MIPTYSAFTPELCRKCGRLVFAGQWDGMAVRLDRFTVPLRDAIVLEKYAARLVVVVYRSATRELHGQSFSFRAEIDNHRNGERNLYAINHLCGTRPEQWKDLHHG